MHQLFFKHTHTDLTVESPKKLEGPLLIFVVCVKVLYLLGAMSLSMALQLDRHGLWNLLGPSLFALGIMAVAWVSATQISCTGAQMSTTCLVLVHDHIHTEQSSLLKE